MITVLLVEDNESVATSVCRYLKHSNYAVLHAVNGESAIQIALEHHPDVILMDINMPGIDGVEAIRRIRSSAEAADIPIIASTGQDTETESARCLDAGACRFIGKPYRMKDLVEHINVLCESRQ